MGDAAKASWKSLDALTKNAFTTDFLAKINSNDSDLIDLLASGDGVGSWMKFDEWKRPNLKKDIPTLKSLQKIRG